MFSILVKKELRAILQSPKFITTFATSSLLIIFVVLVGISEYKHNLSQYNTGIALGKGTTENSRSWHSVSSLAYREPDPMQIFVSGINNDIGRFSSVNKQKEVKLQNSSYSDDPIFAVFRSIDFSFIITIVISLFAIMFTYNSINGEKEEGTLRLVFSNSISRAQYIGSKMLGSWFGLIVPILIPILISFLLLLIFQIDFKFSDWTRLFLLTIISLLYYTFFIIFGIFISSSTKNSSTSFLILLTFWIITVFIIPRVGAITAAQFIHVPSQAEVDSQLDAFSKDTWNKHINEISEKWRQRNLLMAGMNTQEREMLRDENSWVWMQEDDLIRKEREADIAEYSKKLYEGYRNNKIELRKLALRLSRLSPASAYQLSAMNLASSDIDMKVRYEDAIQIYRDKFLDHAAQMEEKEGGSFGIRINMDSETGISITDGRSENKLDFSELPQFVKPKRSLAKIFEPAIPDLGILVILILVSFGASVLRFSKFDLR